MHHTSFKEEETKPKGWFSVFLLKEVPKDTFERKVFRKAEAR